MRITYKGREIKSSIVDYGDGSVLIMYKDAGDSPNAEIVNKTDIVTEEDSIKDICEVDGENEDTYGDEHYWHCGRPRALDVDGIWMCEDHAGELGYGPKQEEYGFDPDDGLSPAP